MSKIQVFFLSLVGALPAGFLSYLLGMYLINQPSGASSMVMVFSIVTLLCSATLAVMPFLILAMYYSNYDPPKAGKKGKTEAGEEEAGDSEEESETKADTEAVGDAEEMESEELTEQMEIDDDDAFETIDEEEEQ